jgi:hypothetical protein
MNEQEKEIYTQDRAGLFKHHQDQKIKNDIPPHNRVTDDEKQKLEEALRPLFNKLLDGLSK